jgi:hypothetical protein
MAEDIDKIVARTMGIDHRRLMTPQELDFFNFALARELIEQGLHEVNTQPRVILAEVVATFPADKQHKDRGFSAVHQLVRMFPGFAQVFISYLVPDFGTQALHFRQEAHQSQSNILELLEQRLINIATPNKVLTPHEAAQLLEPEPDPAKASRSAHISEREILEIKLLLSQLKTGGAGTEVMLNIYLGVLKQYLQNVTQSPVEVLTTDHVLTLMKFNDLWVEAVVAKLQETVNSLREVEVGVEEVVGALIEIFINPFQPDLTLATPSLNSQSPSPTE